MCAEALHLPWKTMPRRLDLHRLSKALLRLSHSARELPAWMLRWKWSGEAARAFERRMTPILCRWHLGADRLALKPLTLYSGTLLEMSL